MKRRRIKQRAALCAELGAQRTDGQGQCWLTEAPTPCPLLIDKVFALGENISGCFQDGCKSPVLCLPQWGGRDRRHCRAHMDKEEGEKYVRRRVNEFGESESVQVDVLEALFERY